MALSRCLERHSPPKSNRYVSYAFPLGYPNSSTICGNPNCQNPGVIWLKRDEKGKYQNGMRFFSYDSHVASVRVGDQNIKTLQTRIDNES